MRETAKLSGIDPSTIVRIEAGEKAYRLTLDRLREVLEAKGVRFIPALEGDHEAGVALRWGAELSQCSSWNDETPKSDKGPGRKAASTWDDFAEGEPVPPEIEDLRTFWRTRPAEWAALHEASRHALLREMHQAFGLTSVIATHNPRLAAACDRVLRLEGGRLVPAS